MANNPITEVRLLNVPLDNEYLHTMYFNNAETQEVQMKDQTVVGGILTNYAFQRKDNIIRCGIHYDDLVYSGCNYVMYKNVHKWYYAFITKLEYVNDGVTNIHIETDVMQTWLEEMNIKPCFVEREHVEDDTLGLHTVPEGLETGEYTTYNCSKDTTLKEIVYVLGTTLTVGELSNAQGGFVDGIYSSLNYTIYPNTKEGVESLNNTIKMFQEAGKAEAIKVLFTAPKAIVETASGGASGWYWNLKTEEERKKPYTSVFDPVTTKYLDGYSPNNNKLLTFPYRYLVVSNNNGNNAVYQFELFNDPNNISFKTYACLTPGCSIRLVPCEYKILGDNNEEGINGGKYPISNWSSDVYTNWLTQNSVNIGISVAGSALTIVGGIVATATGAGAAVGGPMIVSGIMGVASSMGQVYQHSLTPPQAEGNVNSGDVITASGFNCFHYYTTGIKKEYAKIIDKYLDTYGYKVNIIKTPAKNHRPYYWYTKTVDCNISGKIPAQDIRKIKECYNKGITFWRHIANVGNYNLANANKL